MGTFPEKRCLNLRKIYSWEVEIMKLILRILFIPVTALFLAQVLCLFFRGFYKAVELYFDLNDYLFLDFIRTLFLTIFVFWIIAQFLFEVIAFFRKDLAASRWLKHLRYAPVAALVISCLVVAVFDFGMIEYTKWRINGYIYSNSISIEKPEFDLYVDSRGWCGNGNWSRRSDLYFDTASAGISSKDERVRARSLLMTIAVRDSMNETRRKIFDAVLKNSCADQNVKIVNIADEFLSDKNSSCSRILDAD